MSPSFQKEFYAHTTRVSICKHRPVPATLLNFGSHIAISPAHTRYHAICMHDRKIEVNNFESEHWAATCINDQVVRLDIHMGNPQLRMEKFEAVHELSTDQQSSSVQDTLFQLHLVTDRDETRELEILSKWPRASQPLRNEVLDPWERTTTSTKILKMPIDFELLPSWLSKQFPNEVFACLWFDGVDTTLKPFKSVQRCLGTTTLTYMTDSFHLQAGD